MIIVKISLGCKISKTLFFYVISYMNENGIPFLYYVYFKLVLEFMTFLEKKESSIFNFLCANFLSCMIGL